MVRQSFVGIRTGLTTNGILAEAEASFFEADVALLADDEVVEHFDIQELACLDNLLGHLDIFRTGRGVSRRVIVHYYEGGAVLSHRFFEKLAYFYHRCVDIAFVDVGYGEHLVLGRYLNPPTNIASF